MTPKRLALMLAISAPMVIIYYILRQSTLSHLSSTEDVIAAIVIGGACSFIAEYLSPLRKKDEDGS